MSTKNSRKRTKSGVTNANPEVTPPANRKKRHLTAQYKLRVLEEIDDLPYGQIGAYLRREGLYSSQITKWRRQREAGELAGLEPQKRGPKVDETARRLAELERENEQLRSKLAQAEVIIAVQKKLARTLDSIAQNAGEKS
jgi:transposase-like protein